MSPIVGGGQELDPREEYGRSALSIRSLMRGSARRRGAGRRRRRSRDEEEQDGAEVVVADTPPSAGDRPCSASYD